MQIPQSSGFDWTHCNVEPESLKILELGNATQFEVEATLTSGSNEYIFGVTDCTTNADITSVLDTLNGQSHVPLHLVGFRHGNTAWARATRQLPFIPAEPGTSVSMKFANMCVTFTSGKLTSGPHGLPHGKYRPCVATAWGDTRVSLRCRATPLKRKSDAQGGDFHIGKRLLEEKKFRDTIIRCRDRSIPVHCAVLAAASPVFDRMLGSGMCEDVTHVVQISDATPEAVEIMLQYIYTGCLPAATEHLSQLFMLANKYMLPGLSSQIGDLILSGIDETNAMEVLKVVRFHSVAGDGDAMNLWEQLISQLQDNHHLFRKLIEELIDTQSR